MKQIYLILLTALLLNYSTNIQSQNDTLVLININNIRIANVKLNERLHLIEINTIQDSIIKDYKQLIDNYDNQISSFTGQLNQANAKISKLNQDIINEDKKANRWKYVAIGGVTISFITIILLLAK